MIGDKQKWEGPIQGSKISTECIPHLEDELPAVYLWKRCLSLQPECATDSDRFKRWLIDAISSPFVHSSAMNLANPKRAQEISMRPDFVRINGFEVGGGRLTTTKVGDLIDSIRGVAQLQEWYLLLQKIGLQFGPVLYVGETSCLKTRLSQHVSQDSPLNRRLAELNITIEDTALHYLPLCQANKQERRLLEQILTHLLVAPLTYRAG